MFILTLVSLFKEFLGFFPSIFRPFIVVLVVLSFVYIIIEIISSLWRIVGR